MALAAVVWAQGPWGSPPDKWSEKAAKRILSDSPWARTVILPYHPYVEMGRGTQVSTGVRIGNVPPSSVDGQDYQRNWPVIVRWSSSKTIRRAMMRTGAGLGATDDRPRKWIEITVLSATLTQPLPYWEEADLRRSTSIQFGHNGEKREPDDVRVDRHSNYYQADAYIFAFRSQDEDGRALVDEGVKEIHFQCRLGPVALRAKFEPAKMVAHDGPDY
jgi:hypothetical protein